MDRQEAIKKLVLANRILSNENVFDVFGHISVRNPENPETFLLSCSRSPHMVTEDDIMVHDLDGNVVEGDRPPYAERIIHAKIYAARPDVNSVCHNHAYSILPFSVTGVEIRPVVHVGGMFYKGVPFYDEYDVSDGMQIRNPREGERVARKLGDKRAMVLRGHGAITVGASIEAAVMASIYLMVNADIQERAMRMGQVKFLSEEEGRLQDEITSSRYVLERAWNYWVSRLGYLRPE